MTAITLRRYTDIPALIYLLRESAITLLDPDSWDDRNDLNYLSSYKSRKKLTRVLALCFCEERETYHHWRVFANGSSGICVRFRAKELLAAVQNMPGVRAEPVKYLTLDQIRADPPSVEDLPFLKRYAFEPEKEFRLVFATKEAGPATINLSIPRSCIERVTLSPWMPPALADHLKVVLRGIEGCADLNIFRSTLVDNKQWKKFSNEP